MRNHREQNKGIRKKKTKQPIHQPLKHLYWDDVDEMLGLTEAELAQIEDALENPPPPNERLKAAHRRYVEYLEKKYK